MSDAKTTWTETEYTSGDLMAEIRRVMAAKRTGQLVLHLSQGVVCAVVFREKMVEVAGTNGNLKISLDRASAR